ncbi:hypothetical protein D3C78_1274810 [compost metagenome]
MSLCFQPFPVISRHFKLVGIVSVEHEHDTLIGLHRWRLCAINDKADTRRVGVLVRRRQENRLALRCGRSIGGVRQEAVVTKGPQMRVEEITALLTRRLDRDLPAALQRFLEQRRQRVLQLRFRQMVEQNFSHPQTCRPTRFNLRNGRERVRSAA